MEGNAKILTQSNKISELSLENISKLTLQDKDLFERFYNKEPNCTDFSNSWFYTIQSTIFGGQKYFDGKTLIAFTTKQPNKLPFALTQYLGENAVEKAFNLGIKLMKTSKEKVVFKNLNQKQFEELKKLGCSDYKQNDHWNKFYKYDDDTFPETVIDLEKTIALKGTNFRGLRYKLNHAKKHCLKTFKCNEKITKNIGMKIIEKWTNSIKKRFKKYIEQDQNLLHSTEIHKKFLELIYSKNMNNDYLHTITFVNDKPHGMTIGQKLSNNCIGLYTNITSYELTEISEANLFGFLKEGLNEGYKYANLGGSEFQSLFNYKNKFKPIAFNKKFHAVLYP